MPLLLRRLPVFFRTPFRVPFRVPLRTPLRTPFRTPLRVRTGRRVVTDFLLEVEVEAFAFAIALLCFIHSLQIRRS